MPHPIRKISRPREISNIGCRFSLSGSFCYDKVRFYVKFAGEQSDQPFRFQPICAHHLDYKMRADEIKWYFECIPAEEHIAYCLTKQVIES